MNPRKIWIGLGVAAIVVTTILVIALPGPNPPAAGPPPPPPGTPRFQSWGLGLALPATMPAPRYQEDRGDLQRASAFILGLHQQMAANCVAPDSGTGSGYAAAIQADILVCTKAAMAAETAATQNKSLDATRRSLVTLARDDAQAFNQTEAQLMAKNPGNVVDAEVAALLGDQLMTYRFFLDRDIPQATSLLNQGQPPIGQLAELAWNWTSLANLQVFIRDYPWKTGTCSVDAQAAGAAALSEFTSTIRLARAQGNATESRWFHSMYGDLEVYYPPRLAEYERYHWWPGLLAISSDLPLYHAYWENFSTSQLPTQREAWFQVASYANQSYSITGERVLAPVWDAILGQSPWTDNPQQALTAKVVNAMPWAFAGVTCS
ncbi:MAG: hypothetical protein ACYDBQ_01295 [Thermoplasmatota archaeon]